MLAPMNDDTVLPRIGDVGGLIFVIAVSVGLIASHTGALFTWTVLRRRRVGEVACLVGRRRVELIVGAWRQRRLLVFQVWMNVVDGCRAKQLIAVEHLYPRHRHIVRHRPRQRHWPLSVMWSPCTPLSVNDTVSKVTTGAAVSMVMPGWWCWHDIAGGCRQSAAV